MSGPFVRPAGEADIDAVADLLHRHMNAKIARERWRLLLDYPWRPDGVERGWLVEDRGTVVGFMGTVYSDRHLDEPGLDAGATPASAGTRAALGGGPSRFCDLSSWYLLRDYRAGGIGDELLRAGMAKPCVTYHTMTARRATGRKIRALGFSVLDDTRSLFRPTADAERMTVVSEREAVRDRLSARQRLAFDAHDGFAIHNAYVEPLGLWLCFQRKLKGEAVAYHEVLHASDWRVLSRHAQAIADTLVTGDNGVLAVDSRWILPGDDAGEVEAIPLARWYRSPRFRPADVDHLYGEVVLLDQKLP